VSLLAFNLDQPRRQLAECDSCFETRDRREIDSCVAILEGRTMTWRRFECGCTRREFTCGHCGENMRIWNDDQYAWQCFEFPSNCHKFVYEEDS
jgi:hypothetical protein